MIEEALWKILAFILAVILLFVAPLITLYDRQDAITYSVVFSAVSEFSDVTRELGVVREQNLHQLLGTLSATGNTYDVQLEHYKKVYVPIYDPAGVFMDDYYTSYEGVFNTDIYAVLNSVDSYPMNAGDLFFIQIENTSKTRSQVAKSLLFNISGDYPTIVVRNGGLVRYESH